MNYTHAHQIEGLSEYRSGNFMWYNKPADRWLEALPLGNGSIGAMVFGGIQNERYQLNHDTLYSDEPGRRDIDIDITEDLNSVVAMIDAEQYGEADELVTRKWLGRSWPCYQPMADLLLNFTETHETDDYYRFLDFASGIHGVSYRRGDYRYTRESFLSHPDDVLALRMTTDSPAGISGSVGLTTVHPTGECAAIDDCAIMLTGKVPGLALRRDLSLIEQRHEQWKYPEIFNSDGTRKSHAAEVLYGDDIGNIGMSFCVRANVNAISGTVEAHGDELRFDSVTAFELILTATTSFNGFDKSPSTDGLDPMETSRVSLSNAEGKTYDELKERHIEDHSQLYSRLDLQLPDHPERSEQPTDQRVEHAGGEEDPSYFSLYYQFARYLTIAGSRSGTQPLNLQGIWNNDVIPPWASGYTININTQMNYWPVASGNLIECEEPLMRLVKELSVSGSQVAKEMYHLQGWVAHHNTTIWRSAQPVDNIAQTSFWPMGSGWLCRHLWDHYLFTCDDSFLRETAIPLMKGASIFYLGWLVEDESGNLQTPVGTSPEHAFVYTDPNGSESQASVSSGPTMDMSIIRDCLSNTLSALTYSNSDADLRAEIQCALERLLPFDVAADGQLKEWNHAYQGIEQRHRHLSHLYGAYPGEQIREVTDKRIYDAVGRTLEVRGEDSGGWSSAWKANLWARRRDGERALRNLSRVTQAELTNGNLFNGHREWQGPIGLFQIDGNMGGACAIIEMLVQSRYMPGSPAEIDLLPALPAQWADGEIRGARCRGGFEISLSWHRGKLTHAEVISQSGNRVVVSYADEAFETKTTAGSVIELDGHLRMIT